MKSKDSTYREIFDNLCQEDLLQEALELVLNEEQKRPDDFEVLATKTLVLGKLYKHEESLRAANDAIAVNPNNHEIYSMKGVGLVSLKRYEESLESFNMCLALAPNYPIAIQKKVSILAMLERYTEAVNTYEQSDLPNHIEENWLNTLGYLYLETKDYIRAKSFLHQALRVNPFVSTIHFNLARIHKHLRNTFSYLLHKNFFRLFLTLEKTGAWKALMGKFSRRHITEAKYFVGSGTLFLSIPQKREIKSILKLLRNPSAMALCNESWHWFAVNIPYDAVNKNGFSGDIDIVLKRPRYIGNHDAGFTYRGFQVKSVSVDKHGNIKSAKRGRSKLRKIKKQLDVLKDFGCEQIFFLELFVLERGYSTLNTFPSTKIQKEISEKAEFLKTFGYGYVVVAEEPSDTHDEESGGIEHIPLNILLTTSNPIGPHFQKLVDEIDKFTNQSETQTKLRSLAQQENFGLKIGYCRECKLTLLVPTGPTLHICGRCQKSAY